MIAYLVLPLAVVVNPQVGILILALVVVLILLLGGVVVVLPAVVITLPIVIQNHLMEVGKWHLNKEKINTKNRMFAFLS